MKRLVASGGSPEQFFWENRRDIYGNMLKGSWPKGQDTAFDLITDEGWAAISFDMREDLLERWSKVKDALPHIKVQPYLLKVGLDNYQAYIHKHRFETVDYIQVDIDSFDCELLKSILDSGFRPKVFECEVCPIPTQLDIPDPDPVPRWPGWHLPTALQKKKRGGEGGAKGDPHQAQSSAQS